MAWNEPDEDNRDPWRGRKNPAGPPDLDEVLRKMQEKLGRLFNARHRKGGRGGAGEAPRNSGAAWGIALVLLISWLVADAFYRIEPAERGIVRRFGSFVDVLDPGPHFRLPRPIEYVTKVNVDAVKDHRVMATMLTGDENIVDVEVACQYRVRDPDKYLFMSADPDDTVRQLTESSIREIIGMSAFDFVITEGRAEIAIQAQRRIQGIIDQYDAGIEITSVNMQPVKPPEEVQASFDDAIKSRED
ncbi:MAG: FtsH protease activity modulator HflK, partial [Gammaproteobacteria bacterium]|nr:FtsH protease activity modulator HflK [Gammaproteobacteria bacterium]